MFVDYVTEYIGPPNCVYSLVYSTKQNLKP